MLDFWNFAADAGLVLWVGGTIFFLIQLKVFLPGPLRAAPTRQGTISLPIVFGVIILYYILLNASALVAVETGLVPAAAFRAEAPAASAPATSTEPEISGPSQPQTREAAVSEGDKIVYTNAVVSVAEVFTIGVILLAAPRMFRGGAAGWGIHARQFARGFPKGLFGFLMHYPIVLLALAGVTLFYRLFHHEMSEHSTFEAMDQHLSLGRQVILCVAAIVVAPIAEEIVLRGLLQTSLIQYGWGLVVPQFTRPSALPGVYAPPPVQRWTAIVVTSVAFALLHPIDQAPIIFVLALGLGYIYERTGNLWAPIALHMAFNSTNIATYLAGGG